MSNTNTLKLFGLRRRRSQKLSKENKTRHLIKTFSLWEVVLATGIREMSDASPLKKTRNSVFPEVIAQHTAALTNIQTRKK